MKLLILGLIFWITETACFGWNRFPSCTAESVCDVIAAAMMIEGYVRIRISRELSKGETQ